MTSNFKIEGLDCANCAAELERKIGKIEGVKEVSINFFMQRMSLIYDENNKEEIIKKVEKVIKKEEPDVEIKKLNEDL